MASYPGSRSKDTTSEASLLEQVRLLKIENDTLRTFIIEKGFGEILQQPSTPCTPITSGKGCGCKSNCSSKACGCVKKDIPCSELCRCQDQLCQNSKPDKENIGVANKARPSEAGEKSLIKPSKLTLRDKKRPRKTLAELLPETNKRHGKVIKPRSIFTPEIAENCSTFEDVEIDVEHSAEKNDEGNEAHKEKKAKKKKNVETENLSQSEHSNIINDKSDFKTTGAVKKLSKRMHFKQTDLEESRKNEPPESQPANKINKETDTRIAGITKRVNFEEMDKEDCNEPLLPRISKSAKKKNNKKVEKKGKNVSKKPNHPTSDDKASQDFANSEFESESPNKNLKVSKKAQKKTRQAEKHNNQMNFKNEEVASRDNKHLDCDSEPKQNRRIHSENECESPNGHNSIAKKITGTKQNNHVECDYNDQEPSHADSDRSESANSNRNYTYNYIQNIQFQSEPNNYHHPENYVKKENVLSPTESNASGRRSYGTSYTPSDDDNSTFNPMKPRRQLSRSPLPPRIVQQPHRIDVSNVPLPIRVEEETEEQKNPPADFFQINVDDWDKHQATLVKCSKCHRTFYPHRVQKHEMHCKRT